MLLSFLLIWWRAQIDYFCMLLLKGELWINEERKRPVRETENEDENEDKQTNKELLSPI